MPELIRSFTSILRTLIANRRYAPRYRVRLPFSVSVVEVKTAGALNGRHHHHRPPLTTTGQIFDLSATGIGMIVPSIRIGDQYLTGEGRVLRVVLELKDEAPLSLHVRPVRYERLDEPGDHGYLIGAHILEISAADRARYLQLLRSRGEHSSR